MTDEELCKNEFEKWFLLDEDFSNKHIKWCAWKTSWNICAGQTPTPPNAALDDLEAVLCDPEGKCCISGSDEDRQIVDRALAALRNTETKG